MIAQKLATIMLLFCCVSCAGKPAEKPKTYQMRGRVIRLDPQTNVATIHNENVPGWMEEMTMQYPVENKDEYLALRSGENIAATVNVTSEGFWLTNVKESKEPKQ